MSAYEEKFKLHVKKSSYHSLCKEDQEFLKQQSSIYKFSFQEVKQLVDMSIDLHMWDEAPLSSVWGEFANKKQAFKRAREYYEAKKSQPHSYENFDVSSHQIDQKFTFVKSEKESLGLGMCPVASPKTRCCNLLTLDAVESCGFDCSYCSIQSFYNQNKIGFDTNFAKKLESLELDPNQTYHIGTGQASDSLLWGNREGILEALFTFARANSNVILEFKTKSDNIKYLLENEVPKNIICTWSLNTPTIITNEEHLSASLPKRLAAARALADKGVIVGFHFHPIVVYENYLQEYKKVYDELLLGFEPHEIAMISFGTLTFIKPVIKQLRERNFKSKILQMPMEDASGKASYPLEIKQEMFKHAYESFKPWHNKLFFYMCMEDHSLWMDTFGYQYSTNVDFERDMLSHYAKKLKMEYLFN
jgi:spore photoproduct lyase